MINNIQDINCCVIKHHTDKLIDDLDISYAFKAVPKQIEVWMHDRLVGLLRLTAKGLCEFEYSSSWLQSGFSISPIELPLDSGVMVAREHPFYGRFGVFDDCLPDGWGWFITKRFLHSIGISVEQLDLLQLLCLVGSNGRGALEFRPDRSFALPHSATNFKLLENEIECILNNKNYMGEHLIELFERGGLSGGARPKMYVMDDEEEWLVKLQPKSHYQEEAGFLEYNFYKLAIQCGIQMMPCKLFNDKYFGTRRFDRQNCSRQHVVSVAGLLNINCIKTSIDYGDIMQLTYNLTHSIDDLWKLYRQMCFNVLIGKKDDHAKNFSFLYDGSWHLAPAYDMIPSNGFNKGYHSSSINASISPRKSDLIAVADKYCLSLDAAKEIYDDIASKIKEASINTLSNIKNVSNKPYKEFYE